MPAPVLPVEQAFQPVPFQPVPCRRVVALGGRTRRFAPTRRQLYPRWPKRRNQESGNLPITGNGCSARAKSISLVKRIMSSTWLRTTIVAWSRLALYCSSPPRPVMPGCLILAMVLPSVWREEVKNNPWLSLKTLRVFPSNGTCTIGLRETPSWWPNHLAESGLSGVTRSGKFSRLPHG